MPFCGDLMSPATGERAEVVVCTGRLTLLSLFSQICVFWTDFHKSLHHQFQQNRSSGCRDDAYGQTGGHDVANRCSARLTRRCLRIRYNCPYFKWAIVHINVRGRAELVWQCVSQCTVSRDGCNNCWCNGVKTVPHAWRRGTSLALSTGDNQYTASRC
jgi:hypothetical protein